MNKHQIIATLGYGFDKNWKLQPHVIKKLKKVKEAWEKEKDASIVVCGRWTFYWDLDGITPPTTEAFLMKQELVAMGVPENKIIKEDRSKDTIGNLFFLKQIMKKYKFTNVLIICTDFHLIRVKFLIAKIFDQTYHIDILPLATEKGKSEEMKKLSKVILQRQKIFLKDMKQGDETFLEKRLYTDPYYQVKRESAVVAKGEVN